MTHHLAIDWQLFSEAVKNKRWLWGGSLRDWAARIGISAPTLSRAECGREISAENYLTLCRFIGADPMAFTREFHVEQSENGEREKDVA